METLLIGAFSILGPAALLLLGTKFLADASQIVLRPLLKKVFANLSETPLSATWSGVLVSFVVQSPITAMFSAISFASSGLFNLNHLRYFLVATGLPTALLLWWSVIHWGWLELAFLGLGIFPSLFAKDEKIHALGKLLLGLGLLALGSRLMILGLETPQVASALLFLGGAFALFSYSAQIIVFVLGSLVTIAFRSLLVSLVLALALFEINFLSETMLVSYFLGANLGAFLSIFFDRKELSVICRRGLYFGFANAILVSVLIFIFSKDLIGFSQRLLQLMGVYSEMENGAYLSAQLLPLLQVIVAFSFILSGAFVGSLWVRLVEKVVPNKATKEAQKFRFLGGLFHVGPVVAIEQAHLEVKKMAAMVESILQLMESTLNSTSTSKQASEKILKYEEVTDRFHFEMTSFLSKLMQLSLTERQGVEVESLLRMTNELECIADRCKAIFYCHNSLAANGGKDVSYMMPKLKSHFTQIMEYYELLFADMTDEEGGVFANQTARNTFKTKGVSIATQFHHVKKDIFENIRSSDTALVASDLLNHFVGLCDHTTSLYEAYMGYHRTKTEG